MFGVLSRVYIAFPQCGKKGSAGVVLVADYVLLPLLLRLRPKKYTEDTIDHVACACDPVDGARPIASICLPLWFRHGFDELS